MSVDGQRHAPAALPPWVTQYLLYGRLGGPQGRSGRLRKISPPPGFDPAYSQSQYRVHYPGLQERSCSSRCVTLLTGMKFFVPGKFQTGVFKCWTTQLICYVSCSFSLSCNKYPFLTFLNAVQLCRTKCVNLHSGRLPVWHVIHFILYGTKSIMTFSAMSGLAYACLNTRNLDLFSSN